MAGHVLTVALVSLIAVVSPGPDFFIVLKNSLNSSRKMGVLTALGVASALLIHLSYSIFGISALMTEGTLFPILLKYVGACYLFYIGVRSFLESFKKKSIEITYGSKKISAFTALSQGFLTNLLNPKCALFFLSFFSQFLDPADPLSLKIGYGAINWTISLTWFVLLSYLLTIKTIANRIDTYRLYVDRILGIFLMLLSLKLFF